MAETVLDRIVASVQDGLAERSADPDLRRKAEDTAAARQGERRSLRAALGRDGPRVIAECKRQSPSAGLLRADFDPVSLARSYAAAGAAAISVVVEREFFGGDPEWLARVREVVPVPVLRKDFIVEVRQLEETVLDGADAVLLIQRILTRDQLAELLGRAGELGLDVLLELFADEDPGPAVESGTPIIGVNARDLATFEVRLDRVAELARAIPADRVRVAESGIHSRRDLVRLREAGYGPFLIGEHLVTAADPGAALGRLLGG